MSRSPRLPHCLLGPDGDALTNDQPQLIVDPAFWSETMRNGFHQCVYRDQCASQACLGLNTAYINPASGTRKASSSPMREVGVRRMSRASPPASRAGAAALCPNGQRQRGGRGWSAGPPCHRGAVLSRHCGEASRPEAVQVAPDGSRRRPGLARHAHARTRGRRAATPRSIYRRSDFKDVVAIARCFAHLREVSGRMFGGKRHHDVQLIGAWSILFGVIAEMATGEGKTLTAGLAAATVALAGTPVHVVTVNDYLARRDAELIGPLYKAVGLTVGTVVEGIELSDRQRAYDCDITYCTNKELAFDYLRDRMVLGQRSGDLRLRLDALASPRSRVGELRLRGLHFALVNEADSVLVDEARTPLVISGQAKAENDVATIVAALALAEALEPDKHYRIMSDERRVGLTLAGRDEVTMRSQAGRPGPGNRASCARSWCARRCRRSTCFTETRTTLSSRARCRSLIHPPAGAPRTAPGRTVCHQMIEIKEELELSEQRITIARMTYRQVLPSLWSSCRHDWDHLPSRGRTLARACRWRTSNAPAVHHVYPSGPRSCQPPKKWQRIVARMHELHATGAPVLVGTSSVAASGAGQHAFAAVGLVHQVLNAAQHADEAAIVARAGEVGRITVVTSMAGRGTDIRWGPGLRKGWAACHHLGAPGGAPH